MTSKTININTSYSTSTPKNIKDISFCEDYTHQINILNMLVQDISFIEKKYLLSNLRNKINGYKQQDKKHDRYEKDKTITLQELINKLQESSLKCNYCTNNVLILYNNKYDKQQWTLDRINNYDEHTCENCCISCLSCNLKRRRTNSTKFKFTKQLNIVKQ